MSKNAHGISIVAVFLLAVSCSPQLPSPTPGDVAASASLSADAISMVIEEITCPGSFTLVRVLVEAPRSYWGDLSETPPPHAMLRDPQLADELGHAYRVDNAWGDQPYTDPSKGTLGFRLTAAFQGLACDVKALTFTSAALLGGIPSDGNFRVDVRDRTLGDSWRPPGVIGLAGIAIPIDELRIVLLSSLEDGATLQQPALEFQARPIEDRGLRLECLDILWIAPDVDTDSMGRSCEAGTSLITSSIAGGPLAPLLEGRQLPWNEIELRAFGSVVLVEPRTLVWHLE